MKKRKAIEVGDTVTNSIDGKGETFVVVKVEKERIYNTVNTFYHADILTIISKKANNSLTIKTQQMQNVIQKLFKKYGFDLENDNNAAELADECMAIVASGKPSVRGKFTKGEWVAYLDIKEPDGSETWIISVNHTEIATCFASGSALLDGHLTAKESGANAMLIAQAPALLQALVELCDSLGGDIKKQFACYDHAQRVIALAINKNAD